MTNTHTQSHRVPLPRTEVTLASRPGVITFAKVYLVTHLTALYMFLIRPRERLLAIDPATNPSRSNAARLPATATCSLQRKPKERCRRNLSAQLPVCFLRRFRLAFICSHINIRLVCCCQVEELQQLWKRAEMLSMRRDVKHPNCYVPQ